MTFEAPAMASSPTAKPAANSITATYSPATAVGDRRRADNGVVLSRDAAGRILVNDGAVAIKGGTPTVANTLRSRRMAKARRRHHGQRGERRVAERQQRGGAGNDTLTGGPAPMLFGRGDNDSLLGKAGNDLLFGGSGNVR